MTVLPGLPFAGESDEPEAMGRLLAAGPARGGGGAVATYVSLFLILFVFFIVLFSIASEERARAHAALVSVDAALGHLPSAVGLIRPAPADSGPEDPAKVQFIRDVDAGLGDLVPATHAAMAPPPGMLLSRSVPTETLFQPGTATLREQVLPILTRLAVLLQRHHSDARFAVALSLDSPDGDATARSLAETRTTAVASWLYAQGCPADALEVSLRKGGSSLFRLDFFDRPADTADNP